MTDRAPADVLREQYGRLSDEELVNRVATGKTEYTEIAWAVLQEEVSRRRLEAKITPLEPSNAPKVERKARHNWIWPKITDAASAKNAAMEGVAAAGWVTFVTAAAATANVFFGATYLGLSGLAYVDAAIFALIGFGVYRMSRLCAVIGLAMYIFEQIYMQMTRSGSHFSWMFILLSLAFLNSIRGTFGYRTYAPAVAKRFEVVALVAGMFAAFLVPFLLGLALALAGYPALWDSLTAD
jgi:hypothetical protein